MKSIVTLFLLFFTFSSSFAQNLPCVKGSSVIRLDWINDMQLNCTESFDMINEEYPKEVTFAKMKDGSYILRLSAYKVEGSKLLNLKILLKDGTVISFTDRYKYDAVDYQIFNTYNLTKSEAILLTKSNIDHIKYEILNNGVILKRTAKNIRSDDYVGNRELCTADAMTNLMQK